MEWEGARNNVGYGVKRVKGKAMLVHRLAFADAYGRGPEGVLRHTCDNRRCYNPTHLVEGTHAQNSQDMVDRGRSNKGERHPNRKLSDEQVVEIKENSLTRAVTQRSLAKKFGVSESTITAVIKNRSWTHVE